MVKILGITQKSCPVRYPRCRYLLLPQDLLEPSRCVSEPPEERSCPCRARRRRRVATPASRFFLWLIIPQHTYVQKKRSCRADARGVPVHNVYFGCDINRRLQLGPRSSKMCLDPCVKSSTICATHNIPQATIDKDITTVTASKKLKHPHKPLNTESGLHGACVRPDIPACECMVCAKARRVAVSTRSLRAGLIRY